MFQKEDADQAGDEPAYKAILREMRIADLVDLAEQIDADDYAYLKNAVSR